MKTEGQLTRELVAHLRQLNGCVVFRHVDRATNGIPDISVTWIGKTTWFELKRGSITGTGIQLRTLEMLSRAGRAYFVLYKADSTSILEVVSREPMCVSSKPYDHELVADFLIRGRGE